MRASFVFSEVMTGLRRNVTMTVAMILTTMVSLFLLGVGLLVVRMIDNTQTLYEDRVQVNVFLTNDISANDQSCAKDPCRSLRSATGAGPCCTNSTDTRGPAANASTCNPNSSRTGAHGGTPSTPSMPRPRAA